MSKLKQFLLLAMIGLLSAFVVLSLAMNQIRQERQTQHYQQLNDLLHSTGLDYIETFDPFTETIDMDIGLYADGEGYGIVTASLAKEEVTGGEVQYSAVYPASTGDETIRVWYGICGTEAEPQLLLLLDEDEPPMPVPGHRRKPNHRPDRNRRDGEPGPDRPQRATG